MGKEDELKANYFCFGQSRSWDFSRWCKVRRRIHLCKRKKWFWEPDKQFIGFPRYFQGNFEIQFVINNREYENQGSIGDFKKFKKMAISWLHHSRQSGPWCDFENRWRVGKRTSLKLKTIKLILYRKNINLWILFILKNKLYIFSKAKLKLMNRYFWCRKLNK